MQSTDNSIDEQTRRDIFDTIRLAGVLWSGGVDEVEFLGRMFDLENMESTDPRHDNAAQDIWRHRVLNPDDWDDEWIFRDERFDLLHCEDEVFMRFLCETISPVVQTDDVAQKLLDAYQHHIRNTDWQLEERTRLLGRPVFQPGKKVTQRQQVYIGPAYELRRLVGSGGFGHVYACIHENSETEIAVKILIDETEEDVRRFQREIRMLSEKLDHPSIVRVLDSRLDSSPYFYAMPLYSHSLAAFITDLKNDHQRIKTIFEQILDGVEYAHSMRVVHRDLKPENILVGNDDELVISDFGLGKDFDTSSSRGMSINKGLGTALYRAPEQINSIADASMTADIYAMGRILYQMYTADMSASLALDSLPKPIVFIVSKCLEHQKDRRFQSVAELRAVWSTAIQELDLEDWNKELSARCASLKTAHRPPVNLTQTLTGIARIDGDHVRTIQLVNSMGQEGLLIIQQSSGTQAEQIIAQFCNAINGTRWNFEEVDSIAQNLREIYDKLASAKTKGIIFCCLVRLAVEHHRYPVFNMLDKLLNQALATAERLEFDRALEELPPVLLVDALNHLSLGAVDSSKLEAFNKARNALWLEPEQAWSVVQHFLRHKGQELSQTYLNTNLLIDGHFDVRLVVFKRKREKALEHLNAVKEAFSKLFARQLSISVVVESNEEIYE